MDASSEDAGGGRTGTVLGLLARPSGWRRIRLFSASARAPHVRRRADLTTLLVALLALAAAIPAARTTDDLEAALLDVATRLPGLLDPLFALAYDALALWAVACLVLVVARGHWRLAAGLVLAIPASVGLTAAANRALDVPTDWGGLAYGPVEGVPVQLVVAIAVASLASREMSRPFRTFGRRAIVAGTAAALALPVTAPYRVVAAVLVAVAAASLVRFALGSPISAVTGSDVREDLADLGLDAEPVAAWSDGVHEAIAVDGRRVAVRVLGRDEWDNQLAVAVWRFLWYRKSSSGRPLVGPRQRIERQALLLLLARSRGVPVTDVVVAGASRTGDALVATEVPGPTIEELGRAGVDDELLDRAWAALDALHAARIAHGAIDARAVRRDPDGEAVLASFDRAEPLGEPAQVHADRAQLLVATAVVVGADRAIAAALRALAAEGDEAAAPLVSFLQTAALDGDLRDDVEQAELALEDLRAATAEAAGIEEPELQKIWRVSWGSILRLGLLALVGYLLISQLADIGFDTIVDSIRSANPWILAAALAFGQLPRVASAASLRTASPAPVPLGRVTRLQFATSFVNLAVPSTAARVAVSIRFFQRSGATPAGALSAGALDSVSGFIAQVGLLVGLLLAGIGSLGWNGDLATPATDRVDLYRVVGILLLLVALALVALLAVPKLRAKAGEILGQLRESLRILRSPGAVVRLIGFNVLAELLFSTTIWIVLQAFGQDVSFADVIIINEAVALFAGLMPVPGGVGVTEGALTAGFTAVGVPEGVAFSAALCYRMCTFYLPPIWGYLAFDSLRKEGYL
ncbi:MAG: flippase-like domain-containing protein [Acidimicrobiales bacterium]|nr:flippase-like domain-containing protein [Acidimicrobiales bacterium]HRW37485.1 lysylphosphatidylglycerol synthase transmembrane domain-containing protein [Aquihabitans sp.]